MSALSNEQMERLKAAARTGLDGSPGDPDVAALLDEYAETKRRLAIAVAGETYYALYHKAEALVEERGREIERLRKLNDEQRISDAKTYTEMIRAKEVEVERLRADLDKAIERWEHYQEQVERLETCGVIELMVRNPNVDSWVKEHEARTEQAEARLREMVALLDIESLASIQHNIWSHWMRWFFSHDDEEGRERWRRQMVTPYADLTERERESDRQVVREFFGSALAAAQPDEDAEDVADVQQTRALWESRTDSAGSDKGFVRIDSVQLAAAQPEEKP